MENKKKCRNTFKKVLNPETIYYAVFGVLTTILGVAVYRILLYVGMDYHYANLISLIIGKLAAYICNKLFVFKVHQNSFVELLKEFGRFVVARGASFFIDYFGVIFAVEVLHGDKVISKYIFAVLVLILNYIFGKLVVFKKKDKEAGSDQEEEQLDQRKEEN
ncbi:MAG: GtrA family protein [Clostridiaceae bacterium]